MQPAKPDKKDVMLTLLKDAWVYVHLDPRREGVALPEHLRRERNIVLQYGYNMPIPIADFVVDDRGIGAQLSFQRVSHATFVPWAAVFAITDGNKRAMVWEGDVPADLNLGEPPPQQQPKRPALTSVPLDGEAPPPPPRPPAGVSPLRAVPLSAVPSIDSAKRGEGPLTDKEADKPAEKAAAPAEQGGDAPSAEPETPPDAPPPPKPGKRPRPSYLKLVD